MSKRKPIKTTTESAIAHWSHHICEAGLSVDWSEAETHCWRCGCEKDLERCHIIPDSLRGKDEPSNIVLLCKRCHSEGPNVEDPEIMWDWIKAYKVLYYETFWSLLGMKEYQFIYRKSISEEIESIFSCANVSLESKEAAEAIQTNMKSLQERASSHFGQPYFNTATMAGLYRMMLKSLAKSYAVPFPVHFNKEAGPEKPWWKK